MSKGPGAVEARITELLAQTRDRALTVGGLADNAYGLNGTKATRAQRLSATRAAHRVLRRLLEMREQWSALWDQARTNAEAALGRPRRDDVFYDREFYDLFDKDPAWIKACELSRAADRVGWWETTTRKGHIYFHATDVPVQVWAVTIDRSGVHWFDAELTKVTERNVVAQYAGEKARLDRSRLFLGWAWWRGVRFVSSNTGRIAAKLEEAWWERYGSTGAPPPSLRMPLAEAMALLGVRENYTKDDVLAAFRRKVKKAHPDLGGTPEMFRKLVEARDRLLAAIGARAKPPKPPAYAPSGMTVVYRSGGSRATRLSMTSRLTTR
jgi:hypothetical protein